MKTREVATLLRNFADFLDSRPEFNTESVVSAMQHYPEELGLYTHIGFWDKDKFVAAVKAIGSSTKAYTDGDYPTLVVTANGFPIELSISRDKVCKKTVTFDCEPLFSEEEVRSL